MCVCGKVSLYVRKFLSFRDFGSYFFIDCIIDFCALCYGVRFALSHIFSWLILEILRDFIIPVAFRVSDFVR